MQNITFYTRFEEIVERLYEANGNRLVEKAEDYRIHANDIFRSPDFVMNDGREDIGVEVKFYRASTPSSRVMTGAVAQLTDALDKRRLSRGKLVLSIAVPKTLRDQTLVDGRIEIVDIHDLLVLSAPFDAIYRDLIELMRVSRLETASPHSARENDPFNCSPTPPSVSTIPPVEGVEIRNVEDTKRAHQKEYEQTTSRIRNLIERIEESRAGPKGARAYERLCLEAIKELFEEDFGEFKDQHRISDGFHRLDFIASIKSENPFWNSLRVDFRSRYVVFEVKNYPRQISQSEIYSTEKYLFTNALRSVAILIARKGENKGALHARQGALREMGKLIIMITQDELIKMLERKIANEEVISILAEKIDDFLTTLAR